MPDPVVDPRSPPVESQVPGPGALIDNRYVVEGVAGEGTSGVVLRVRHRDTGRQLALKLLASPATDRERFLREAQVLGRLDHPRIVSVTDYGEAADLGGRPYLVMDYVEGRALRDALSTPIERQVALDWLAAIAEAVDHAHGEGVLHRDLKPENVVLCEVPGRGLVPSVLDFGLAGWSEPAVPVRDPLASPRLTDAHQLVGTPAYVAPERIRGEVAGSAADVYSLGVVAYELLTGRLPFDGPVLETLDAHLCTPPPRPELPPALAEALLAALAKDPAARPSSAGAFAAALQAAHGLDRAEQAERRARPRRRVLGLGAAALSLSAAWWTARADWVQPLELRTRDWRWSLLPQLEPDPRLLLIPIDDESLARDARPLAEWGDSLAQLASRALDAGARGVAVDLLLPAQFGETPAFVDVLARHGDRVALAAASGPDGRLTGLEALDPAARAALPSSLASRLFAVVNVQVDPDGVCRRARSAFGDAAGSRYPAFATRAAELLGARAGATDEWTVLRSDLRGAGLARLSWSMALAAAQRDPRQFSGRLLVVGSAWTASGDGNHAVLQSGTHTHVSGLELQGLLIASQLAPDPVHEGRQAAALTAVALLTALILLIGSMAARPARLVLRLAAVGLLYTGACLLSFTLFRQLLPLAAPWLTLTAGTLAGLGAGVAGRHGRLP